MPHAQTELTDGSAVKPEPPAELNTSVGTGIPGMEAATRLATEIFTSLMFGLMVIPVELPMAMGLSSFQAVTAARRGAAPRGRDNTAG